MSTGVEWSPDEPQGTETNEAADEAFDEEDRLDSDFADAVEEDPSIDPANQLDLLEVEEAGVGLDDPEVMVMLQGGGDDPDGLGGPPRRSDARSVEDQGWDLDSADSAEDDEPVER